MLESPPMLKTYGSVAHTRVVPQLRDWTGGKFGFEQTGLGLDSKEHGLTHFHDSGHLIKFTPKPPVIPN